MLPVLIVISVILLLVYFNGLYNENYWKKRGVTYYKKNKVLGVFWDFLTKSRSFFLNLHDIYKQYPNEPAIGIGSFVTPTLYVRDPANIQHVLATNFKAFVDRGFEGNEGDLLADNLLFQNGKKWKLVRQSMTPLFTAAKLKSMYYIMDKSAQDFVNYLKDNPKLIKGDTFTNVSTFCSAAIGAAVFGVTPESIFDSPFLKVARTAFQTGFIRNTKFTIGNINFRIFKMLRINLFSEYEDFFIGAIKQVLRQREIDNVKKHDFADICLALQKKGMLRDLETGTELQPTDELLAAQGFIFFVAGVEPTATAIFSTLVELGRHPDSLERLHKEIDELFEKHDGKFTFDIINNMEYLDMVICEALRLYPPIGFLTRQCTEETVLPVGNIKIDVGTKMYIPVYELHHDPKYHPDPEVYNPERFSPENRHAVADTVYMPFGRGNRNCVGIRYALLQAKCGLIYLLRSFTVKTHVAKEGIKYQKERVQVRMINVDVEFVPRDQKYRGTYCQPKIDIRNYTSRIVSTADVLTGEIPNFLAQSKKKL